MTRYAIPLAGLLCLALGACAPPPPKGPTPVQVTSVTCPATPPTWSSPGDLLTHVQYVRLVPQPNSDFSLTPLGTPDPPIQNDLAAAFNYNSNFSVKALCPLDGIFINLENCTGTDPSTCSNMQDKDVADNSWGLRTPSGKKFIAISLGLWRCLNGGSGYCAPSFTQYNQRLFVAVLDKTAQGMETGISPPTFTASTDDRGLAILAALAHERGHIYWWETFVQPPGTTPSPATLMNEARAFCNNIISGGFYQSGLWNGAEPVGLPANRFVEFAALNPYSSVANLPRLLRAATAVTVIDGVYTSGNYPSLLAAYSPDEDFVEAFEWSVLRNAKLSNRYLALGSVSVNLDGTNNLPILTGGRANGQAEQKLECFDTLSAQTPRP